MDIDLTPIEARVLASLLEKETTTPDYYPLSLSAIQTACNQKSNRDPVMSLGETEVLEALDGLTAKRLVREKTPSGSRVTKYAHRLSNTLGLTHEFSREELAVLCVLMLRGAQTVGEIRARTGRLCQFKALAEVEQTLSNLANRKDGPYVKKLARQAGRKEARYAQLLCGDVEVGAERAPESSTRIEPRPDDREQASRLTALEDRVEALREELEELKRILLD